jgi:pyridoxal phosphate enzyme (YggS family)
MDSGQVAQIRLRLSAVERRIAEAAARSGRAANQVSLVVITKGHPTPAVEALLACGVRRLGENRVEEARPKIDAIGGRAGVAWHLVGPLQSRKVRLVEDRFELIHAVDRLKIAQLLDRNAAVHGHRQPVLLEWNVSGEDSKAGWRVPSEPSWEALLADLRTVVSLPNLSVVGLMTVGPLTADGAVQHATFRRLAELRRRLSGELECDLPELSMGMTDDFEAAIEEGATLVRIGRAILGERM